MSRFSFRNLHSCNSSSLIRSSWEIRRWPGVLELQPGIFYFERTAFD